MFRLQQEENGKMKKSLTTVAFHGTPEQEAQLLDVIAQNGAKRENLMPILQEAQEIYGYLPIEVQKIIAEKTGTPLAEVFGVVSFYSQFALNPKGSVAIAVCLGTACYVKGSGDLVDRITERLGVEPGGVSEDGKFSLEATRCIGACGLAPVLTVNGEVYGRLTKNDVDGILDQYM